mmetsp:Transcript_9283/g.13996  ORF Transcript_9283/g.13996 Transcript_9283/m.13996 type:complete len:211 (+) Transcript_9283:358-990(+)
MDATRNTLLSRAPRRGRRRCHQHPAQMGPRRAHHQTIRKFHRRRGHTRHTEKRRRRSDQGRNRVRQTVPSTGGRAHDRIARGVDRPKRGRRRCGQEGIRGGDRIRRGGRRRPPRVVPESGTHERKRIVGSNGSGHDAGTESSDPQRSNEKFGVGGLRGGSRIGKVAVAQSGFVGGVGRFAEEGGREGFCGIAFVGAWDVGGRVAAQKVGF